MEYEAKEQIMKNGEDLLNKLDQQTENLIILRLYNIWYTEALEFVQSHAESRLKEFEKLHTNNQGMLCQMKPELQQVRSNLTIQIAIIEGSTDHTPATFDVVAL